MVGLQRVQGFVERTRQGLYVGSLGVGPGKDVGVNGAKASSRGIDLALDAVQPGQQLGRQCQVDVAGGVRRTELKAGGVWLAGVLGDADRRTAVTQRKEGIDRCLKAGYQTPVRVGAGVGKGQQRRAMTQQPADVVERCFAHAAVAVGVVKNVAPTFEQVLVKVHPVTGLAVKRLGHKGHGLTVGVGCHLGDVLDQHRRIASGHQTHHRRLDFYLTGATNFVMVVLDRHAHGLQVQSHFGPQVVELIFGRDGMVAAVQRNVMAVAALSAVPVGLVGIQAIACSVDLVLVSYVVKDVELELWPPAAFVGDAGLKHIGLSTSGDVARIVGKDGVGVRFQRGADKAECGHIPERVRRAGGEVRHQYHVAGLDAFETHCRTVEANAVCHQCWGELVRRHGDMMPAAPQVAEFEVHHLNAAVVHVVSRLLESLEHRRTSSILWSLAPDTIKHKA